MSAAWHPSVPEAGWAPIDVRPVCLLCEDVESLRRSLGEWPRISQRVTRDFGRIRRFGVGGRCRRA
jgi:hypothetical protein